MHDDPGPTLFVVDAQASDPVDEGVDLGRPVPSRNVDAEVDEGVAARRSLAVPRPPTPDRDLDLDHRLEPIDIGSLEESDLDLSHGSARITSPGLCRCPPGHPRATPGPH